MTPEPFSLHVPDEVRRYAAKIPKTPERRAAQAAYMREYRRRKAAAE